MAKPPHSFKRLVLGLQPGAPHRVFSLAAGLAELLDLELLGLFLEDTSLRDLAAIPFARELRPLNGGWHPIDLERLSRDIDYAARNIERMFAEAARNLATGHEFEVVRGPLTSLLPSLSRSGDIVMIIEPANPAERASQQFAWLIDAAFRSAAAVMIVPPRVRRSEGPVIAIAASADDPSLEAAAAIARAAEEELVVADLGDTPIDQMEIGRLAAATGGAVRRFTAGLRARADIGALDHALHEFQERLLVVTRGARDNRDIAALASRRGVPVLVVEPAAGEAAA